VAGEPRTVVLYEAPRRVAATLSDLAQACGGDRRVAVVRELTKAFEETWRGTLRDAASRAKESDPARGEHVIVLDGAPAPEPARDDEITAHLSAAMAAGGDRKSAVADVASTLGVPRRRVYDLALRLSSAAQVSHTDRPR
jgi:16S rRNA (cytidine1402-2'-O)-methyltransferase